MEWKFRGTENVSLANVEFLNADVCVFFLTVYFVYFYRAFWSGKSSGVDWEGALFLKRIFRERESGEKFQRRVRER